jgi:L-asparaginase/Glu-tRNA(Gln) amidotransferase subunit D
LLIFINNTGGTVAGSIRYASATVNAGSYTFTCVGSVTAAIANTANVTVEVWRAAYSGMFYNESAG